MTMLRARWRTHAGAWVLVTLLGATMVSVAGGIAPATTRIEDRALQQMLAEAPFHERDITIIQQLPEELAALQRAGLPPAAELRDEVGSALPPVVADAATGWGYQRTRVTPAEPPDPAYGASLVGPGVTAEPDGWAPVVGLYHQPGLEADVTVVDGAAPATDAATGVVEVMAESRIAGTLGVVVGGEYLLRPGALGVPPDPAPARTDGLAIRLVGVFEARDRSDAVWEPVPELLTTTVLRVPATTPWPRAIRADLVTDQAGMDLLTDGGWTPQFRPEGVARFRIDEGRVDAGWAAQAAPALIGFTDERPGRRVLTGLGDLLDRFHEEAAATRAVVAVVTAGILAVLCGLLLLVSRLIVDRRREELELVRARGASITRVGRLLAAEAVWAAAAATTAGVVLTRAVVGGDAASVLPGLVTGAVVGLAVPVAGMLALHRPRPLRDAGTGARGTAPVRVTGEAALLAAAVLGVVLLHQRGLTVGRVDPYLSLVPTLVGVAVAVTGLRLLRALLRVVAAAARRRGVVTFLGAAQGGRAAPAAPLAVLVLVLAVALGGFAGAVHASVSGARDAAAVDAVGAHARVVEDSPARILRSRLWPPPADLSAAVPAVEALDGITAVAAVRRDGNVRVRGGQVPGVDVVAVDAPAYQEVLAAIGVSPRLPAAVTSARPGDDPLPALATAQFAALAGDDDIVVEIDGQQCPAVVVGEVVGLPGPDRGGNWLLVPRQALAESTPVDELVVAGDRVDGEALRAVVAGVVDGGGELSVTTLDGYRATVERTGFHPGITTAWRVGTIAGGFAAALAVVLVLVVQGGARRRLLRLLRPLGMSTAQARGVVAAELVPLVGFAVVAGAVAGAWLPPLVSPALGLDRFTGGVPPGFTLQASWAAAMAGLVLLVVAVGVVAVSTDRGRRTGARRARWVGAEGAPATEQEESMQVAGNEEFRRFVTERTPELFAVAYRLAGRQDAAERLLQAALERLALRWRKVRDPYGWAVAAMHQRSGPWWRRFGRVRPLAEPAGPESTGGRAVDVGDLAVAGARRLRLARVAGAVGAVVVLGAAAVVVVPWQWGGVDPAPVDRDLSTLSVVTSFYDQGWHVLDPETGEYRRQTQEPGVVSPDLRTIARVGGSDGIIFRSTVADAEQTVRVPFQPSSLAWSPDGALLSAVPAPFVDGQLEEVFERVAVVDVATGEVTVVTLDFPEGRAGWWALTPFWTADSELAVSSVEVSAPELPPSPGAESGPGMVVAAVDVFDRTGALVAEYPLSQPDVADSDEPHMGLAWMPAGLMRDEQFVLFRRPGPDVAEVAAAALAEGPARYAPVSLALGEPPADEGLGLEASVSAWPVAWLPEGRVVVRSNLVRFQQGGTPTFGEGERLLFVDVERGEVVECPVECTAAGLGSVLGVDLPVPGPASNLTMRPADGLSPQAAHVAF